jgi:hypothetical protein
MATIHPGCTIVADLGFVQPTDGRFISPNQIHSAGINTVAAAVYGVSKQLGPNNQQ